MPKVPRNRTVFAKHEPAGLLERITISDPHRFADVGKPRRVYNPPSKPLIRRPFDPEIAREAQEEIERKSLLARLLQERRLLDRISDPKPPLIDRIDMRAGPSFDEPKPLPDLHFCKTKILLCVKEYNDIFGATADRLEPLYAKLELDGRKVAPETFDKLKQLAEEFDTLYYGLEKRARKLTNKQWRYIKRDLKRIGTVSFTNLST